MKSVQTTEPQGEKRYPYLGFDSEGNVILFHAVSYGTIVKHKIKEKIGFFSDDFNEANYNRLPRTEQIILQND